MDYVRSNLRIGIASILLILVLTSCQKDQGTLPPIQVVGDLEQWVNIHDQWDNLNKTKMVYNEMTIEAMDLYDLIHSFDLVYLSFDIVLKAEDDFMVRIDGETLKNTFLGYSKQNRWVYVSEKHPVNSRIKNINEIIIVKKEAEPPNHAMGLNIIHSDNTLHMSMGQLLCQEYRVFPYHDGDSSLESQGEVVSISVMKQKKIIKLSDMIKEDIRNLLIMNEDGLHVYETDVEGYIEIDQNHVNYMKPDGSIYNRDIKGLMINPPNHSVMDTYYDTLHFMENNERVLILFLDGFSYEQYAYIKENKPHLFLSSIQGVKKATTVYKPVTNAGFAAMITGKEPEVNGVMNRSMRELKVDSIFDKTSELYKKSILIEGNTSILNTSIRPILNIDKNKNGYTDDEIYLSAKTLLDGSHDLALIHFHSIDDVGHQVGHIHEDVMAQIEVVDQYVESLVKDWKGKVIIVSDHGMHDTAQGGSHGEFRAEDLFIPYVILNGGQ